MSASASLNADYELMSSQIEIRCPAHLLRKYASLDEAFKSTKYYIEVRESENGGTTMGEQYLLNLKQDCDDVYHSVWVASLNVYSYTCYV